MSVSSSNKYLRINTEPFKQDIDNYTTKSETLVLNHISRPDSFYRGKNHLGQTDDRDLDLVLDIKDKGEIRKLSRENNSPVKRQVDTLKYKNEWRIELNTGERVTLNGTGSPVKTLALSDWQNLAFESEPSSEISMLQCEYCSQSLDNPVYLEAHLVNVHGLTLSQDSLLSRLTRQEEAAHLQIDEESLSKDGCDQNCNMFTKGSYLEEEFQCDSCFLSFKDKESYKAHCVVHDQVPERSYQCHFCGMEFFERRELIYHARNHTGERPFECDVCGKDFTRKSCLKRHKLTHIGDGDKPHKCKVCGKGFVCKTSRNQHAKKHVDGLFENHMDRKTSNGSGQKRVAVYHDNRKSINANSKYKVNTFESLPSKVLPVHINASSAKPSFSEILFESQQMLADYKYKPVLKPFPCKHCDRSYIYKRDLKRHHMKHHPGIAYGF